MDLTAALTEYRFACDADNISPQTWRWYAQKLAACFMWCRTHQDITTVEQLDPPLIRRYLVYLQQDTAIRFGKPISSYTVHGYAQVIRGFLAWSSEVVTQGLGG
jgi:hypothetical protein